MDPCPLSARKSSVVRRRVLSCCRCAAVVVHRRASHLFLHGVQVTKPAISRISSSTISSQYQYQHMSSLSSSCTTPMQQQAGRQVPGNKNFSINFCQRQDREQLGIECAGESQQQLGREYGPELSPGARERKPRQKSRDGKCFRVAEIYTRGWENWQAKQFGKWEYQTVGASFFCLFCQFFRMTSVLANCWRCSLTTIN